jgi:hypothetical protein
MTELTYAALRQIMYQPSAVWLATEYSGDRWLHDQWVMLNVTGNSALRYEDATDSELELGEIPDGAYKLMADQKLGLQPRDSIPQADLEAYFAGILGEWRPANPTQWSVAEHPGKAMLWEARGSGVQLPCLLGESTWTAIKRHYPDCEVHWQPRRNLFQFSERGSFPFCFAAGIQVPTGQERIAVEIARLHVLTQHATAPTLESESTSNEE